MRRLATVLPACTIALACTVALACGDSPTEPDPTVDGVWVGEGTIEGVGDFLLTIMMTEGEDGSVTGTGWIGTVDDPEVIALSIVEGTHTHPDLSVTLGAPGYDDMVYSGVVAETQITGNVNGSGFIGEQVILVKE